MEIKLNPDDEVFVVQPKKSKSTLKPCKAKDLKSGNVFKVVSDGPSYRFRIQVMDAQRLDVGAIVLDAQWWHVVQRNGVNIRVLCKLVENCPFSPAYHMRNIDLPQGQVPVADIQYA
jgi:hypothetical protein